MTTDPKPGDTDNVLLQKILNAINAGGGGGGGGGTGTVTNVGLTMPAGFSVANSPVTTSGSLDVTLDSQAANLFLASPSGGAGVPVFRSIVSADLPAAVTSPTLLLEATSGASARLTALTAAVASITVDDLIYAVIDVAGTPDSVSATVQQLFDVVQDLDGVVGVGGTDILPIYSVADGQTDGASLSQVSIFALDSLNGLSAAAALALADKFHVYQAGSKAATIQQIFDATNVLTAAGALATSDKLAAYQAGGKAATVQQVLDSIDALAAAGTLVGTNTFALVQTAAAKEATLNQLVTFLQSSLLSLSGSAFIIVGGSSSATTNGTALIAAYVTAVASTPHGAALSDSNRFTILLLPGTFDLGASTLAMNTQFIDIVGLGRNFNGTADDNTGTCGGCVVTGSGTVINKTANNAHLMNFAITTSANALATPAYTSGGTNTAEIFAYMMFDGTGGANSRGMVRAVAYPGYYYRCYNLGPDGFGCAGGAASGTFVECKSGVTSFGDAGAASGLFINCECGNGFGSGAGGTAGGTFYNCRFNADYSSGGGFFGQTTAAGVFINCDAGAAQGFGYGGTANGTFLWCRATGSSSFGGTGTSTGTFRWCVGGSLAFSGGSGQNANGVYEFCTALDRAFGGGDSGATASGTFRFCVCSGIRAFGHRGTASGTFENCVGGSGAFGGDEQATTGGTASGTFINCRAGDNAFGGSSATGGTVAGTFINCVGGTNCYGSGATTGGTLSGTVRNCTMTGHMRVNLTGKIENMRIEAVAANTSAILLVSTSTGALYNCTLVGTGTGVSVDIVTGTPTVKIAHCRMNKGINAAITNSIGTPYNVDDSDIV